MTRISEMTSDEFIVWIIKKVVLSVIVIVLLLGTVGTVPTGKVGVKTRFSSVVGVVHPGLYFKMPLLEKVHAMDVKTRTINYDKNGKEGDAIDTSELFGASKDLQDVKIGVVVTYHIDPAKVVDIFSQYSSVDNYEANVIEPIVRQIVKSKSAEFTAEELVTKRAEYSETVNNILAAQLTEKSAILENFNVTNFSFSTIYAKAIELKATAEQTALTEKNNLATEEYKAQQRVVQAKGEAEAIKIQAQAINSQGGADYVQLQAIKVWKGDVPTYVMGNSSVPFINLK